MARPEVPGPLGCPPNHRALARPSARQLVRPSACPAEDGGIVVEGGERLLDEGGCGIVPAEPAPNRCAPDLACARPQMRLISRACARSRARERDHVTLFNPADSDRVVGGETERLAWLHARAHHSQTATPPARTAVKYRSHSVSSFFRIRLSVCITGTDAAALATACRPAWAAVTGVRSGDVPVAPLRVVMFDGRYDAASGQHRGHYTAILPEQQCHSLGQAGW
jgi:hypothetical protein